MNSATKAAQVRLNRVTPSHCRVVLDNPPLNLLGPEFVPQIRDIVTELEGHTLPSRSHVETLLTFVRRWDQTGPLLIHCWAGVSRSTAALNSSWRSA